MHVYIGRTSVFILGKLAFNLSTRNRKRRKKEKRKKKRNIENESNYEIYCSENSDNYFEVFEIEHELSLFIDWTTY